MGTLVAVLALVHQLAVGPVSGIRQCQRCLNLLDHQGWSAFCTACQQALGNPTPTVCADCKHCDPQLPVAAAGDLEWADERRMRCLHLNGRFLVSGKPRPCLDRRKEQAGPVCPDYEAKESPL